MKTLHRTSDSVDILNLIKKHLLKGSMRMANTLIGNALRSRHIDYDDVERIKSEVKKTKPSRDFVETYV